MIIERPFMLLDIMQCIKEWAVSNADYSGNAARRHYGSDGCYWHSVEERI